VELFDDVGGNLDADTFLASLRTVSAQNLGPFLLSGQKNIGRRCVLAKGPIERKWILCARDG